MTKEQQIKALEQLVCDLEDDAKENGYHGYITYEQLVRELNANTKECGKERREKKLKQAEAVKAVIAVLEDASEYAPDDYESRRARALAEYDYWVNKIRNLLKKAK